MSNESGRAWVYPAMLWILVVLAPLPILGGATSLGAHVLAIVVLAGVVLLRGGVRGVAGGWVLGIAGALLVHTVLASLMSPCRDMLGRSLGSLGLLLMLIVATALVAAAAGAERGPIGATLRWIMGVVVLSVLLDKAYLLWTNASVFIRPSGIFEEPSHLALSCAPVLAALVVSEHGKDKAVGWISVAMLMGLAASATLFVLFAACAVVALMLARRGGGVQRLLRGLGVAALVLLLVALSPYRDDFLARIVGLGEVSAESNVSSLIYLNGLQSALANVEASQWFGLGLNRMGCEPRPVTDVTPLLEVWNLADFNYNDGSFTAAKLLSELGALGALWLLVGFGVLVALIRAGRREADADRRQRMALAAGALLVITLGAFVRGTGYFSGPYLLGLFAFFLFCRPSSRRSST